MNTKGVVAVAVASFVLGVLVTLSAIGLQSTLRGGAGAEGAPHVAAAGPEQAPPIRPAPPASPPAEPAVPAPRPAAAQATRPAPPPVTINGRSLDASQQRVFVQQYGVEPLPGAWWYDARSGLYGPAGMASTGFLLPGHDFGRLSADASRGDTGVYLNGRNLPLDELFVLNAIWGTYIQPGRYWLDAMGNVGYEGLDVPVGNLVAQLQMLAAQGGYGGGAGGGGGGGGGGGDNIWSSRLGAGNYDQGNTRGYVSVPGHGPIGYGFD